MDPSVEIHHLQADDNVTLRAMLDMFGITFDDVPAYSHAQPDDDYLRQLLADHHFIAVAATASGEVIGGLTAYVLPKPEQTRKEVFIYDLAVRDDLRRRGIATALITKLKTTAQEMGAYLVMVAADPEDEAAVSLYSRFSTGEDVQWFDIPAET